MAFLAGFIVLLIPPKYLAEATFREKSKSNMDTGRSGISLLVGGADLNENAAVSLMKSRKLAEKVIQKENLQISVQEEGKGYKPLQSIVDNLKVEWAYLRDIPYPVLDNTEESIVPTFIQYAEEIPVELKITFTTEDTFVVQGEEDLKVGELDKLFIQPTYSFSLSHQNSTPLIGKTFKIKIEPINLVARRLLFSFSCETDLRDKTLIKLAFKNSSRKVAADYLNLLMALYQENLRQDQQQIAEEQIAYLHKRQEETSSILKEKMEEHALSLSSTMATIDFLFQTQQSYTQKLLLLDMELRRLQKGREEGIAFYDRYWTESGDSLVINQILTEIRQHRQQADSIGIALRNTQEDHESVKNSFNTLMAELKEVKSCCNEAKEIFSALENHETLPRLVKLADHPKYIFKEWQNHLQSSQKISEGDKDNFAAYLSYVIHLLEVEEKIIQERLIHQQAPQSVFQGVDLPTANQVYVTTSKSLHEIEAEILHHEFLLDQLKDPTFETSSLSTVLNDSVSREIINRAGQLALLMQDQENRTLKELDRLKNELALQKEFLSQHLTQTISLQGIRKKLYEEKITNIQNMQLELIQQKVSVLEQSLLDYIDSRLVNLEQEREAILLQQQSLQDKMALMPEKWAQEKLIDQQLEMNRKTMEEITKIIETKNIGAHIDISQSAPIDPALPPINPMRPHFILFSLLGGLIGFFGSLSLALAKNISKGFPATPANLRQRQAHVAGPLSNPNTLKRIISKLCVLKKGALLLLLGNEADYSPHLQTLLEGSGLKIKRLQILLSHVHNLQELIVQAQKEYDWVIVTLSGSVLEGESLLSFFDSVLVTVENETLDELNPFIGISKPSISFICSSSLKR